MKYEEEEIISVLYASEGCDEMYLGGVDDDVDGAVEGEQHVVEPGQDVYPLGPVLNLPERVHLRIVEGQLVC